MAGLMSLEKWRVHLEAAQASGMTVVDYAREHGLSRSGMYSARYSLKRRKAVGVKARARPARGGFVPVVVPRAGDRLTARLPNGVELSLNGGDTEAVHGLLSALSMLRCGA
jgi:hypothetical protein